MFFDCSSVRKLQYIWLNPHYCLLKICINAGCEITTHSKKLCISLLCAMYIFYSMVQQEYTVMLHSLDCTVIESGHSGRVPWLWWDIPLECTACIFGFIGITKHWHGTGTQWMQSSAKSEQNTHLSVIHWLKWIFNPERKKYYISSCMVLCLCKCIRIFGSVNVITELSSSVG